MITDLVRNDLSHTAQKRIGTGYRTMVFILMQVHQMISTVTSKLDYQYGAVDAIRKSPMGSMTGAPKISAMKIIEDLKKLKEDCTGVGYFTPSGDFDFNVIIRSILYNQENQYVFFSVGSAITALSIPASMKNVCLKPMREVLQ
jgi:para-aminobenzoate synthetase component 1